MGCPWLLAKTDATVPTFPGYHSGAGARPRPWRGLGTVPGILRKCLVRLDKGGNYLKRLNESRTDDRINEASSLHRDGFIGAGRVPGVIS
jgi:hypothetical protein